jgi:hypothetical protein
LLNTRGPFLRPTFAPEKVCGGQKAKIKKETAYTHKRNIKTHSHKACSVEKQ